MSPVEAADRPGIPAGTEPAAFLHPESVGAPPPGAVTPGPPGDPGPDELPALWP